MIMKETMEYADGTPVGKYIDMDRKIKVFCPMHGEFHILPKSHLDGDGCPSCFCDAQIEHINETYDMYYQLISSTDNTLIYRDDQCMSTIKIIETDTSGKPIIIVDHDHDLIKHNNPKASDIADELVTQYLKK